MPALKLRLTCEDDGGGIATLADGSELGRCRRASVAELHHEKCISAIHASDIGAAVPV
jgi:hypothetical protein